MGETPQTNASTAATAPPSRWQRAKRWPITIIAIVAGAGKLEVWRHLIRNAAGLWVLFPVMLFGSILRTRPVGLAVSIAGLIALIVHPAVLAAIGLGVGLFAVLVVLFALVGTVLMARQGDPRHIVARPR